MSERVLCFRQRFKVEGVGFFPVDMLRYDECYPRSERDSGLIERNLEGHLDTGPIELERILVGDAKITPTLDRWKSFLWNIVPNSIREEVIHP